MNFDLIIFDCDGVLVDSEVISCRAHADVLSRHGYPITQEQVFDRFLGRSTRQANSEVEAELGRALPDDFHVQLQDDLFRSFEADLQAVPHIHLALDGITQAVCVASSGSQQRMSVTLGPRPSFTIGLRRTFFRPRRSATANPRPICFCLPPVR